MGQLIVTPKGVASTVGNMKENKSLGVEGISPSMLNETIGQSNVPLAHVFDVSLQEGEVPLEWKKPTSFLYSKISSRNKSVNYQPVRLTLVIIKLLETIIID